MNRKWILITLLCVLCVALFCLIATITRIFEFNALPNQFVAAFFEAVITAVITVVLLTGQSSAEELKDRNVKVFEKKSVIFEEYIRQIWKVWEDKKLESKELEDLIGTYNTKILIYLDEKSSCKMDGYFLGLTGCITTEADRGHFMNRLLENNDEEDNHKTDRLRENLFGMINLLSAELGLGGKIDTARTIKIETKMFPNLFRQRLIAELQKELNADLKLVIGKKMGAFEFAKILYEEGKDTLDFCFLPEVEECVTQDEIQYLASIQESLLSFAEHDTDGYYDYDYIVFKFKSLTNMDGAFLCISLSSLRMKFYIDPPHHEIDAFRMVFYEEDVPRYLRWVPLGKKRDALMFDDDEFNSNFISLGKAIPNKYKSNFSGDVLVKEIHGLNFYNDTLNVYRYNYPQIAEIIAKRAAFYFGQKLIYTEDGNYTIMEFIEKYYKSFDKYLPMYEDLLNYLIDTLGFEHWEIKGLLGYGTCAKSITDDVILAYLSADNALYFYIFDLEKCTKDNIEYIKELFQLDEYERCFDCIGFIESKTDDVFCLGRSLCNPLFFEGGIEAMKPVVAELCKKLEELAQELFKEQKVQIDEGKKVK